MRCEEQSTSCREGSCLRIHYRTTSLCALPGSERAVLSPGCMANGSQPFLYLHIEKASMSKMKDKIKEYRFNCLIEHVLHQFAPPPHDYKNCWFSADCHSNVHCDCQLFCKRLTWCNCMPVFWYNY